MRKLVPVSLLFPVACFAQSHSGPSYDSAQTMIALTSATGASPFAALTTTGTSGPSYDYAQTSLLLGYNATTGKYYVCGTANPCSGMGSTGSGTTNVSSFNGRTGAVTPQSSDYSAAQITGLAASATTDATNASNIVSGTLPAGRLPAISYNSLTNQPTIPTAVSQLTRATGDYSATQVSGLAASAITDTTNAANITTGTLPAGRLPAISYASLTNLPTLGTAAAQPSSAFDAAGAASALQATLGTAATQNSATFSLGTGYTASQFTAGAAITAGNIVGFSGGQAIVPTTATSYGGIAVSSAASGASVLVARNSGQVACTFDGAAVVDDVVIPSSTTLGDCHDSGLTGPTAISQISSLTPVVGVVQSAASGAGQSGTVRLHSLGTYGGAVPSLINSAGVTYLYESGSTDTYFAHTLHVGPPGGAGDKVMVGLGTYNSANGTFCLNGCAVAMGTANSQIYLNTAGYTSASNPSVAFYFASGNLSSGTTPNNSEVMFSGTGQSLAQSASLGWSSSSTGAGTATQLLSFRSQFSSPAAGAVSCDTTTKGNGACNFIAGLYQETLYTPATSAATCTAGQFADDANYHYVCTAANNWRRVALSSF